MIQTHLKMMKTRLTIVDISPPHSSKSELEIRRK